MITNFLKNKKWIKLISIIAAAALLIGLPIKLFTSKTPVATISSTPIVPKTLREVSAIKERTLSELSEFVDSYRTIQNRNFENTITNWNVLRNKVINTNFLLSSLGIANADAPVEATGKEVAVSLSVALVIQLNHEILPTIVSYLENISFDSLTPAERNIAYLQLSEIPSSALTSDLASRVEKLKEQLAQLPMEAFVYRTGEGKEKLSSDGSFSILNLNVCGFADILPMLYGGPTPWKERIDSLINRIEETDADLICLQEVFDPEAGEAFYERLKSKYPYFYTNIGPRVDVIGIPSGLFVASKYKIENPQFTLFDKREKVRSYGFFEFDIKSGERHLGHITTTHLQPFQTPTAQEIRTKELEQVMKVLQEKAKISQVPFFLCGDLNIQWGSNEPAEKLLKAHFIDNYNLGRTSITKENRTCHDFTDYWWKANRNPNGFTAPLELIDYALLMKTPKANQYQLKTKRISMGEVTAKSLPDTDHDGLFSIIKIKQKY
ncbi:MAG TPA: endonuclease/exonuclease/phosphatase family protein [Rhabdochlamydiaceae bacterium]|nr:endonuclease/exonuclease/phosphatase family protein [Rhabdochlamydiaceae bacterium]